jgi:hypothetical protein
MGGAIDRRSFLAALGAGAATMAANPLSALAAPSAGGIQPIAGSWFEFQHHATVEGVDWNPALVRFSARDWEAKVEEIAEAGLEYLVLMATAVYYRSFYDSKIYPKWQLACADPLEAVLKAADRCKVKFFIGAGFYGNWMSETVVSDPVAEKQRLASLGELAERYGHHQSFYGWYWPDEAYIHPRYSPEFIHYVNLLSAEARRLKPKAEIMIAPYGTREAAADDEYVRQLDRMDVDIVAYQDEVGVRKSKTTETAAYYERLRKAHDRSQKARLWADVELFEFEGATYNAALVPAAFSRVRQQLEAVSPYVDKILVYQYLGLMNKPGSKVFAGRADSAQLYSDYQQWRKTPRP